jgi:hypothetical protein
MHCMSSIVCLFLLRRLTASDYPFNIVNLCSKWFFCRRQKCIDIQIQISKHVACTNMACTCLLCCVFTFVVVSFVYLRGSYCSIFSFCVVFLYIIPCSFLIFLLAIVWSVLHLFMASNYLFGIIILLIMRGLY